LSDEADFQEKLNELVNDHYKLEKLNSEEGKKGFLVIAQTNRSLAAQADLIQELNGLKTQKANRTATNAFDRGMNERVADYARAHNQDLDQARENMRKDIDPKTGKSVESVAAEGVNAQNKERQEAVKQSMREFIDSGREDVGLNSKQRSLRDDYKRALQDLTGNTSNSLAVLNKDADDYQKQVAASFAKSKQDLENPPGFQRWVDALQPFADRMEDIKANFVDDLSSGITDSLMGDDVDWGAMLKNMRKQLLKAQVDEGLKALLGALHLAKVAPQSPEEKMASAGKTFVSGADKFDKSVDKFTDSIAGGGGANGNAPSSGKGTGGGSGSGGGGGGGAGGSLGDIFGGRTLSSDFLTSGLDLTSGLSGMTGSLNAPAISDDTNWADVFGGNTLPSDSLTSGLDLTSGLSGMTGSLNAPAISDGDSGGGFFSDMASGVGSLFGSSGISDGVNSAPGSISVTPQIAGSGAGGGFFSNLMNGGGGKGSASGIAASLGMSALGALLQSAFKEDHPDTTPLEMPDGIIGTMSNNTVSGTAVAAHANPIAQVLQLAASLAMGNPGSGGGFDSMMGMFNEGGYSSSPVQYGTIGATSYRNAPHYAEGTGNTSGFPAILHPDEAVIPLSRGRKVPVEMSNDNQRAVNVSSNITVIAPNPDAFRKSSGSINRDQNRTLRRAALRNLTG